MLVITADHDDRVVPLHSYKYVAELQYIAGNGQVADQRPLLLKVKKDGGHNGAATTSAHIEDAATQLAYLAKVTNTQWIQS